MGAAITVGGWSFYRGIRPSDYINILIWKLTGKEGKLMSDFEMLSIMLMILSLVVSILIAYINSTKK